MDSRLHIASGQILVYHLFTLANTVDLDLLRALGLETSAAPFTSRRPTPGYIQFRNAPLTFPLGAHLVELEPERTVEARVLAKVFDFGVLSLRWIFPCPGEWEELVATAGLYIDRPALEQHSREILKTLIPRLQPALKNMPKEVLSEDYTIFYLQEFDTSVTAETLLKNQAPALSRLIRGESKALSRTEQNEALRSQVSYFDDDLVVIDWNTAFIYDRAGGAEHMDTLEFANAELLELRFYDRLLDDQMDVIYQDIERGEALPRWRSWLRTDYPRTMQRLMALTVDVIELTEQIENALKFIGDLYSARLYRIIAERLRLREWEASIDDKLKTAQHVYQMLTDQVDTRRSVLMEVIIIVLIAFEILMAFRHP